MKTIVTPTQETQMRYYYFMMSGNRIGPLDENEFRKQFLTGKVTSDTMVWTKGQSEWLRACDVEGLIPQDFCPPPPPCDPPPCRHISSASATPSVVKNKGRPEESWISSLNIIQKHIRNAWIAGVISGTLTLVIASTAILTGETICGIDAWAIIDAVLIFGLSYGIFRTNRTCAVLLVFYFIVSKIMQFIDLAGHSRINLFSALAVAVLFMYFYIHGAVAVFQYHDHQRGKTSIWGELTKVRQVTAPPKWLAFVAFGTMLAIWVFAMTM